MPWERYNAISIKRKAELSLVILDDLIEVLIMDLKGFLGIIF